MDHCELVRSVWPRYSHQFAKLEQLVADLDGDIESIPFLPINIVQGHGTSWRLREGITAKPYDIL